MPLQVAFPGQLSSAISFEMAKLARVDNVSVELVDTAYAEMGLEIDSETDDEQ